MKISRRLKLIWWAVWHGYVPFTVTRVGPDQTKGYKQCWKLWLYGPHENTLIVTADDLARSQPMGAHVDVVIADDVESTPIDADIIDAVRDTPSQNLDGSPGATVRQLILKAKPLDYVVEDADEAERERRIQQSWKDRQPKI